REPVGRGHLEVGADVLKVHAGLGQARPGGAGIYVTEAAALAVEELGPVRAVHAVGRFVGQAEVAEGDGAVDVTGVGGRHRDAVAADRAAARAPEGGQAGALARRQAALAGARPRREPGLARQAGLAG